MCQAIDLLEITRRFSMKAALLAFLALFLVASPVMAQATVRGVVTLPSVSDIVSDDDAPTAPALKCEDGKFCVFPYMFTGRVNDESVGRFQRFIQVATDAGAKAIMLELDTPGGSVNAGHAMARAMEISPIRFVCVADGYVASAGFYILQSCDARYATSRTTLMTHNVLLHESCDGNFYEMTLADAKAAVDEMQKLSEGFAEHILNRAKNIGKMEYLNKIEHGDWVMTPAEALHYGFIDYVWPGIPNTVFGYIKEHGRPPALSLHPLQSANQ
jgi:ATP-dependent protease ClpP protease subunit